jgi:hypothetical protein
LRFKSLFFPEKIKRNKKENYENEERKKREQNSYKASVVVKCVQNEKRNYCRNHNVNIPFEYFQLIENSINYQKRKKSKRKS